MEIQQALKTFAAATNNELFDPEWHGGEWMTEAVETRETIDQFIESSKMWNERSGVQRGEIAGFPFVTWSKIQVRKGDTRRSVSVIDFGDVRYALDADLTYF